MSDQSNARYIKEPVLVSACLLGIKCRYDGDTKTRSSLLNRTDILPIAICPEQMGGLPTPRPASNLIGGDGRDVLHGRASLINEEGIDVTSNFIDGARYACIIAGLTNAKRAVLKDRSPSCGTKVVKVSGKWIKGMGVAAAMLKDMGIKLENADGVSSDP